MATQNADDEHDDHQLDEGESLARSAVALMAVPARITRPQLPQEMPILHLCLYYYRPEVHYS